MKRKRESAGCHRWLIAAWITVMGVLFCLSPVVTAADKFPAGAVTVIVPFKPGGGTDIEVRNDPKPVIDGHDPQLEAAVKEALRLLETEEVKLKPEPPAPIRYKRPKKK